MELNRRTFISLSATLAGGLLGGCQTTESKEISREKQPNVILIVADDLGYGDLGCYGQQRVQTPNIDRLAREGIRFTQHYAGDTVCAPSRCCLMTGLHSGHCSVRGNEVNLMRPDEPTLAHVMKRAGYRTACIGKWGIGHVCLPKHPHQHGFDEFYGYLSMWHAHNYYPDFLWKNGKKIRLNNVVKHPDKHYQPSERLKVGVASKKVEYSHDLFANEALNFIEDNQHCPFFLYLPFTIPHANNEAGQKGMEVPSLGHYKDKNWPSAEKAKAAMISRMDRDVGRILAQLKRLGLDDNTLVIFTSDNGPHKEGGVDPAFLDSNGPLRGIKRDLYEGGIRVPMIARWPGKIQPGSTCHHVSAFWDYLATLQDLVGDRKKIQTDGISFLPSLLGQHDRQKQHEYLYWEFHEQGGKQAVRMGDWKGVRCYSKGGEIELYNLADDIGETQNLADQHPGVVKKIDAYMKKARTDVERWPMPRKS